MKKRASFFTYYCSYCLVWFAKRTSMQRRPVPRWCASWKEWTTVPFVWFGLVKNLYAKMTCSPLVRQLKRLNCCSICLAWFGTRTSTQRRPVLRWCASWKEWTIVPFVWFGLVQELLSKDDLLPAGAPVEQIELFPGQQTVPIQVHLNSHISIIKG